MKWVNDLESWTQLIGLDLHQMEHLSQKIIFSPYISKDLSGIPWKSGSEVGLMYMNVIQSFASLWNDDINSLNILQ
jgi:hypothetical protein